jgi:hypothetical protein
MKKRIIITEKQYREIFLNKKNGNILINEQLKGFGNFLSNSLDNIFNPGALELYAKNLKKGVNKKEELKNLLKIDENGLNKLKSIFGGTEINTLDELKSLLNNHIFTKEDISKLYTINSFRTQIQNSLLQDDDVKKMFSVYKTMKSKLKDEHPDLQKIDDLIDKYIPRDVKEILLKSQDIYPIESKDIKKGGDVLKKSLPTNLTFDISENEIIRMLNNIDEIEGIAKMVKEKGLNLINFEKNYLKFSDEKDRAAWIKISKDLTENDLKLVKSKLEELKNYLSENNINYAEFIEKFYKLRPKKYKQIFIEIGNKYPFIPNKLLNFMYLALPLLTVGGTYIFVNSTISSYNKFKKLKETNDILTKKFLGFLNKNYSEIYKKYLKDENFFKITVEEGNKITLIDTSGIIKNDGKTAYFEYQYDEKNDTFKETSDEESFENSPKGFNEFLIKNPGFKLNDTDIINGEKDIFTISTSDNEEYVSFNYKDGTFIEVPEQE